ncbi:MAG TPA: response regulator, partial [Solirubrobacterales bacterium]|nr:response regulator [Solirubrobacterales bacterium]
EVLGGLFFGHKEPGIFTDRAEHLVAGIAAQAAIAIDNARLYEAAQHEIEARSRIESELRRVNDTLEERVAERTAELAAANSKLTAEIAEREKTEAALRQAQKMEAVEQLTGGIAHDFNNLLTVIAGNLDLLGRAGDGERRTRLIDNAQRAAARGAQLTQQLLAFARRQSLRPVNVDLNRLIGDFEPLLRQAVGEAVDVVTEFGANLWPTLVDPAQIETAVLNLAVNARDAMPVGGRLVVETRNFTLNRDATWASEDVQSGDYVALSVIDSGEGIPAEIRDRIFEPFFTTKGADKGSGLGLSQVYGFVRQSGGHVRIVSEAGVGTSVTLLLPRAAGHAVPTLHSAEEPAAAGGDEVVLVVEDNADVLSVVVAMLDELGYRILVAESGSEALGIVKSDQPIDLVFTDIVMPQGLSGLDVAREARRLRPGLKVLLTSGYRGDVPFGEDETWPVLAKPFRPAELARAVRNILDGGRQGDLFVETPAEGGAASAAGSTAGIGQPAKDHDTQTRRVLIVEDEALILMAAVDMLEEIGHEVLTASNAEAAMAVLAGGDPVDVMLTDINLPDMNGEELARQARRLRPGLPVVFATGHRMGVPDERAGTG